MADDLFDWGKRNSAVAGTAETAGGGGASAGGVHADTRESTESESDGSPVASGAGGAVVWTVSQLTHTLKERIEREWTDVWVEGEATDCRESRGSFWFKLKDGDAVLGAVIWPAALRALRVAPCDGDRVVCRGRLDVYPPKGEYRLVVIDYEQRGLGALLAAKRALQEKLAVEGLLDPGRKRRLPLLPRRVGLVTSLTGAAVRDFLKASELRFPKASIVIAPARVQGDGAARTMVRALARLARVRGVDVVVLARGGGSSEDLWAFNDEELARAIAGHPVPVVSAVGHERDVTIADLVADVRAATPTSAAVAVFPSWRELNEFLSGARGRLRQGVARRADEARSRVDLAAERLDRAERQRLLALKRRLEALRGRLGQQDPRARLARLRRGLQELWGALALRRGSLTAVRHEWMRRAAVRLRAAGPLVAAQRRQVVRELGARLQALSPLGVLERGYAIVRTPAGGVVTDAGTVAAGADLRVSLRRGGLDVRVTKSSTSGQEDG